MLFSLFENQFFAHHIFALSAAFFKKCKCTKSFLKCLIIFCILSNNLCIFQISLNLSLVKHFYKNTNNTFFGKTNYCTKTNVLCFHGQSNKAKKQNDFFLSSISIQKRSFDFVICRSMSSDQNPEFENSLDSGNFKKKSRILNSNPNSSESSQQKGKYQKKFFPPFSNRKQSIPSKQNLRFLENSKQQVVSITYEEIGLFPRSFNRVFDRFFKQLFFDVENLVIQEYRFYRYLFLTTVKCLFILIFVPLGINFLAKNYVIRPVTEYYWNTHNHEIFLNSYQQKQAFREFKNFEEKIYFESLLLSENQLFFEGSNMSDSQFHTKNLLEVEKIHPENLALQKNAISEIQTNGKANDLKNSNLEYGIYDSSINMNNLLFQIDVSQEMKIKNVSNIQEKQQLSVDFSTLFQNSLQKRLQKKMLELANHYNEESIEAVTNFFADILSFGSLCFLLFRLEIQINITKSFLLEVFFGLDDSKKSLLILFVTDLLVGYHSPNIWELFFQTLFDHYGLPESQTTIFLLVATLPVLLDVLFKYLIFRHLNRASPATVATYHAMIE